MESREGVSGLIILPLGTYKIPSPCLVLLVLSLMAIPMSSHHVSVLPLRLNLYLVLKSLPRAASTTHITMKNWEPCSMVILQEWPIV